MGAFLKTKNLSFNIFNSNESKVLLGISYIDFFYYILFIKNVFSILNIYLLNLSLLKKKNYLTYYIMLRDKMLFKNTRKKKKSQFSFDFFFLSKRNRFLFNEKFFLIEKARAYFFKKKNKNFKNKNLFKLLKLKSKELKKNNLFKDLINKSFYSEYINNKKIYILKQRQQKISFFSELVKKFKKKKKKLII